MNPYPSSPAAPRSFRDAEGEPLERYFRALAVRGLMTAEDEIEAALRIVATRRALWSEILGFPEFTTAVTDLLLRRVAGDADAAAEIRLLRAASRALQERGVPAHDQEFAVRRAALVERMSVLDVDGPIADEIAAEVEEIAAGEPGERTLVLPGKLRLPGHPLVAFRRAIRASLAAARAARRRFVEANLRLVVVVARRYVRGTMSLADTIQEGNLGLLTAVGRFDPARGFRFATYAVWWIRSAITRAIAEKERTIRLPAYILEEARRLARARREVRGPQGSEPSPEALAAHAGLSTGRIASIDAVCFESSIRFERTPHAGEADEALVEALVDGDATPSERFDAEVMRRRVRAALDKLQPIEAEILCQYFGLEDSAEQSLAEIAARCSLSRERVRKLQQQALRKVRIALRRRELP